MNVNYLNDSDLDFLQHCSEEQLANFARLLTHNEKGKTRLSSVLIRKQALILNLPGQPKSIKETLEGVNDAAGNVVVHGIFASVPYCIQLLEGPYVETAPEVVAAFRPKSARRDVSE